MPKIITNKAMDSADILLHGFNLEPSLLMEFPYFEITKEPCSESSLLEAGLSKSFEYNRIQKKCIQSIIKKFAEKSSFNHLTQVIALMQLSQKQPTITFFAADFMTPYGAVIPRHPNMDFLSSSMVLYFQSAIFRTNAQYEHIFLGLGRSKRDIYTLLAHESGHLVLLHVYKNLALPYYSWDKHGQVRYQQVIMETMRNLHRLYVPNQQVPNDIYSIAINLQAVIDDQGTTDKYFLKKLCHVFTNYSTSHYEMEFSVKLPEIISSLDEVEAPSDDFIYAINPLIDDWQNRIIPDIAYFINAHPHRNKLIEKPCYGEIVSFNRSCLLYSDFPKQIIEIAAPNQSVSRADFFCYMMLIPCIFTGIFVLRHYSLIASLITKEKTSQPAVSKKQTTNSHLFFSKINSTELRLGLSTGLAIACLGGFNTSSINSISATFFFRCLRLAPLLGMPLSMGLYFSDLNGYILYKRMMYCILSASASVAITNFFSGTHLLTHALFLLEEMSFSPKQLSNNIINDVDYCYPTPSLSKFL